MSRTLSLTCLDAIPTTQMVPSLTGMCSSQCLMQEAQKRESKLKRSHSKERAQIETEWQLYANRLINDKADVVREMDRNRREEIVELARLRDEARQRATDLDLAVEAEKEVSNRFRNLRGGDAWLSKCRALEEENRKLKARRTLQSKRMQSANLAEQRARASSEAYRKLKTRLNDWWACDDVVLQPELDSLKSQLASARLELEGFKAEAEAHRAIAQPNAQYFFAVAATSQLQLILPSSNACS